jgi:hypothetical protein
MSMPSQSDLPVRAPLNANNSWVITQARKIIGYYDRYAVEDWLDEVTDDEISICRSLNHFKAHSMGHPAGELGNYDPDCTVLSQNTIEKLEAVAAEIEAIGAALTKSERYDGDKEDNSSDNSVTFFTVPDRRADWNGSSSSSYESLVSGLTDWEALLNRKELLCLHSESSDSEADVKPGTEPENETEDEDKHRVGRTLTRVTSRSHRIASSPSPIHPRSSADEYFYHVDHPKYHEAYCRANEEGEFLTEHRYGTIEVVESPIERGPEPMPGLRRPRPSIGRTGTLDSIPESFDSTSESHGSDIRWCHDAPSPTTPGMVLFACGRKPLAPEIVRPVPQRAGYLAVPSLSTTLFRDSPFVSEEVIAASKAPALILNTSEDAVAQEETNMEVDEGKLSVNVEFA